MTGSLDGKIAVITGGCSGIGLGTVELFIAQGAKVVVADMEPVKERMAAAAGSGYSTATDLADWLVRELNMPFRDAHHITGAAVKRAEGLGLGLADLPLVDLQALEPRITDGVYAVLTPAASAASRRSYGGTAPDQVRTQIQRWKDLLA